MKNYRLLFLIVSILLISNLYSKSNDYKLSLDIGSSFSIETFNSIYDPKSSHERGWFNKANTSFEISLRIKYNLMYGFQPYVGYHFNRYYESDPDNDLWKRIYRGDFNNKYKIDEFKIDLLSSGLDLGIIYNIHWLKPNLKPYVLFEYGIESFDHNTFIEGIGKSEKSENYNHFIGHSKIEANQGNSLEIGIGFIIPIVKFPLLLELSYEYARYGYNRREYKLYGSGLGSAGGNFHQEKEYILASHIKLRFGANLVIF